MFLFKYRKSEFEQLRRDAASGTVKPADGEYDTNYSLGGQGSVTNNVTPVFFARQMIQDACASQAVLSLLLNLQPSDSEACTYTNNAKTTPIPISIGSALTQFHDFVSSFDAELIGESISNSAEIREAHNSFSRPSLFFDDENEKKNNQNTDEEHDGLYHFVAYKAINGKLYELDGLHPYPIVHLFDEPCTVAGDSTSNTTFPKQLAHVLASRIARAPAGDVRFNLLGLTCDKLLSLQASHDAEGLLRRQERRAQWHRENVARRADYTQLITELIKGIAGDYEKFPSAVEWNKQVLEPARKRGKEAYYAGQKRQFGFQ